MARTAGRQPRTYTCYSTACKASRKWEREADTAFPFRHPDLGAGCPSNILTFMPNNRPAVCIHELGSFELSALETESKHRDVWSFSLRVPVQKRAGRIWALRLHSTHSMAAAPTTPALHSSVYIPLPDAIQSLTISATANLPMTSRKGPSLMLHLDRTQHGTNTWPCSVSQGCSDLTPEQVRPAERLEGF